MTRIIMVVDDDNDIREITQLALELGAGWSVVPAASGSEALERAAVVIPDAILLDVMMPGADGPTTYQRLASNEQTHAIPVIFLTAAARPSERERLTALGAVGVLSKPFDPLTLATDVARLLGWSA